MLTGEGQSSHGFLQEAISTHHPHLREEGWPLFWSQSSKSGSGQALPQEAWVWFPGWKVQCCRPALRQAQACSKTGAGVAGERLLE